MSERITQQDLANMLNSTREAAVKVGIAEAARWQLDIGSKTYGRAYRLWLKSEDESKTGHYTPIVHEYLGMTAAEAFATLSTLRDAFRSVSWAWDREGER